MVKGVNCMRKNLEPLSWDVSLSDFGKRNRMRPTRLEVLGADREAESDFWLEDGLLLAGITMESDREQGPSIEIMLRAPTVQGGEHMTHTVNGVNRVALEKTDGRDEALEIEDKEGAVTIMRFESDVRRQNVR
jgi:hypothetical protein